MAALVRRENPETLKAARAAIDRVDAALATLLERRVALAGRIQRLKPVGGFRGRDMERERRLVEAMARRAPSLGVGLLAPIMNAVIEAGLRLHAARREDRSDAEGDAAGPE
nr:chorismate mutase [Microbispora rosea]